MLVITSVSSRCRMSTRLHHFSRRLPFKSDQCAVRVALMWPLSFECIIVCNVAFINNSNNNCIISCFIADEEFDELCFEFGLELDEIVSHQS